VVVECVELGRRGTVGNGRFGQRFAGAGVSEHPLRVEGDGVVPPLRERGSQDGLGDGAKGINDLRVGQHDVGLVGWLPVPGEVHGSP